MERQTQLGVKKEEAPSGVNTTEGLEDTTMMRFFFNFTTNDLNSQKAGWKEDKPFLSPGV